MYTRVPDAFPVLEGGGVRLREFDESDLPAWYARLTDVEAAGLAGDPVATRFDAVEQGLAHHRQAFRDKEAIRWAIVPESGGASVGSIGLVRLDETHLRAGIGAAVGRGDWNRGYATAAARLVVHYAFGELALARIDADVLAINGASIRVLQKLGFRLEGVLRRHARVDGERVDTLLFGLLAGELADD